MNVSESMLKLVDRIQPLSGEVQRADSHGATIRSRLEKIFQVVKFGVIGNHSRQTVISNYEVLGLVHEYNCAFAASMPLPTSFYEKNKAELNARWSSEPTNLA